MSDNAYIALAVFAWGVAAGFAVVFIHGSSRKHNPRAPLPPGYGERYHYREMFDGGEQDCSLLRPMPADLPEATNVIEAYQRFTACKVCGYQRRVCSSEACPQRRFL